MLRIGTNPTGEPVERKLTAILAADVVGYSRLMGEDEVGTLARLKAHRTELIDPKAVQYGGRTIKLMGDGILMEFGSVVDAVTFAVDVQCAMALRGDRTSETRTIQYRIGINIGDVIVDEGDIYGDGVNVAARLESLAEPGGICISRNVRDQLHHKLDLNLVDLGEVAVKNIAEPVRAFRIELDEKAKPLMTPVVRTARHARWLSHSAVLVTAGLGLVVALVSVAWWQIGAPNVRTISASQPQLAPRNKPSIAVLPFNNMSNDKSQDYFGDGMAEDIITDLSKVSGLFVIARNTSFQYRGRSLNLVNVGRQLGVQYILEGSVRRSANKLRINAQLIDATTGGHIWAERYDGNATDVFALQDKVTAHIINALKLRLTPFERDQIDRRGTNNTAAYDAYLRGLRYLASRKRLDVEGNRLAQAAFEEAIRIDPNYAEAIAGLAWAKWLYVSTINVFEDLSDLLKLAETSVGVRDNALARRVLSRRHFAMESELISTTRKPRLAAAELEAARRLQPSNPDVLADLAKVLSFAGRPEEARKLIQTAMELNPDHPDWYYGASGVALLLTGDYKRAVTHLRKWSKASPNWGPPYIFLGAALAASGDVAGAKAAVGRYDELYMPGSRMTLLAVRNKYPMGTEQLEKFQRYLSLAGVN
mgnify:FL=1